MAPIRMANLEIAARIEALADLLAIQGANPFRIRAYRDAVRLIGGLPRPLVEMVEAGEDLRSLPGIGVDLDAQLRELLDSGAIELFEATAREVPRELAGVLKIEGLGPKKVKRLWQELGVTSVDRLAAAISDGRVAALQGFGPKSAEKLTRAIDDFRKREGRFLRGEAEALVAPLLAALAEAPGIATLEVAGSLRRGVETVGDVDLLATVAGGTEGALAVMKFFTTLSAVAGAGVDRVEASGETRGRVVLRSGLPVDLRILASENRGAALHHFTGSKEHNVQLRALAREKGLRLSEYGIFRVSSDERESEGGVRVGGAEESEVFEALGLSWIPPVLREGRGELEAAREGRLPQLVEYADIRGDLHMHTAWSDGRDSIEEMVRGCLARGYAYCAITDHSQSLTVARGLTPGRLAAQAEEIAEVRERVPGIHLFHGCEVDILKDGTLDLPDEALDQLDLVLVAVHTHFHLDQAEQTARVVRALAHPAVDILVHPTGRLLNRREPYAIDMEAVLEAAAGYGVAVELNANPRRLDLHDRHLHRARERGLRVSIATDAHRSDRLATMEPAILQAQRGWLEAKDVLNTLPLGDFKAWLARGPGPC